MTCVCSNAIAVLEMEWTMANKFAEGWPENTAEGCIQASALV